MLQEAWVPGRTLRGCDRLVIVAVQNLRDRIARLPQGKGLAVEASEGPQGRLLVEEVDDFEVYFERPSLIREGVKTLDQGEVRLRPDWISAVAATVVHHDVHVFQLDCPGDRRSAHGAEETPDFHVPRRDIGPIDLELMGPVGAQWSIDQVAFGVIVEEPEIEIAIDVRTEASVLVGAGQAAIQAVKPGIHIGHVREPIVAEGLSQTSENPVTC